MMRSPTVLTILPEGGDSRKQVMMVLCSGRFGLRGFYHVCLRSVFPSKVPEIGTFLALVPPGTS